MCDHSCGCQRIGPGTIEPSEDLATRQLRSLIERLKADPEFMSSARTALAEEFSGKHGKSLAEIKAEIAEE